MLAAVVKAVEVFVPEMPVPPNRMELVAVSGETRKDGAFGSRPNPAVDPARENALANHLDEAFGCGCDSSLDGSDRKP